MRKTKKFNVNDEYFELTLSRRTSRIAFFTLNIHDAYDVYFTINDLIIAVDTTTVPANITDIFTFDFNQNIIGLANAINVSSAAEIMLISTIVHGFGLYE